MTFAPYDRSGMAPSTRVESEEEWAEVAAETSTHERCPECPETALVASPDGSERYCPECGLVMEEGSVDRGPEWRAYTVEEERQKSRVGAPLTTRLHDRGLTTRIDWRDQDANGRTLSPDRRRQMNRLRQWHERIRTQGAQERNLQQALNEVDRMASALGVPDRVQEIASVIYRRALDADLIRGRSIEGVATAALYAACRREELPRSLDEMAEVSRVHRREIGRTYRYVAEELDIELTPADPRGYLPRFCSELGVDESVRATAGEILNRAVEQGLLSGKSPAGIAGAAIYTAATVHSLELTQQETAGVAGVTEVTIRKRYHEQVDLLDLDRHP